MNNSPPKSALDMSLIEWTAAVDQLKYVKTIHVSDNTSPDITDAKPGVETGTTASSRPTPMSVAGSACDARTMSDAEFKAAVKKLR